MGVLTFIAESLTRKAAWVSSGEMPTAINIGTSTGAMIAHLDVAEVIIIFNIAVSRMTPKTVNPEGISRVRSNSAPDNANNVPRFECWNEYKNCAAKESEDNKGDQ
ncbi:Uncharacterised protein [Providencia stuartii]|nr:Uncharacterised protein [Providencia stuartii]